MDNRLRTRGSFDRKHALFTLTGDAELFKRFLEGDNAAFAEFFDRYDHRLRLYCTKVVGSLEIAEDLTQELWERIVKMRLAPTEIAEPAHYLMKMARNICLKHLQRRRNHSSLEDLREGEHPQAVVHEASHLEELVTMAVAELPLDQREVITLHNYCGYSYEDVAQMNGESVGAVKMRAMRARSRIGRMISAFLALGTEGENGGGSQGEAGNQFGDDR
jgi:RNA polymerase sigma-70 factor (ECF subfamily)